MKLNPADVVLEPVKCQGPGGQRLNKVASCIRATHTPTGLQVNVRGRTQAQNKTKALKELQDLLDKKAAADAAAAKKAKRDDAIKNEVTIRTYDLRRGEVKDHRSGKTARVKDILDKARLDLLREDP